MPKVAIAMSVYCNDNVSFLSSSVDSLLNQTGIDVDIYINVDGVVSNDIVNKLESYKSNFPSRFEINYCKNNHGLAFQLNSIIDRVVLSGGYSFIARMDADDICEPERIYKQVEFFSYNPTVAVLGTNVLEFHKDGSTFNKRMPQTHQQIIDSVIQRCPFNHPTVMFNLAVINPKDLRYDSSLMNTQDYYLWVDLLNLGYKFANLDESLLRFRVDDKFHSRRGIKKAVNDARSRIFAMNKLKIFNFRNTIHTLLLFFLRLSPPFLKKIAYRNFRN